MPQATYHLKCLGIPELRTPDGKAVRIRVKKHLALLVYLAVERGRPHSRDRLVDVFWPHAARERGRHSCATAVSLLRSILGKDALIHTRAGLRFTPPALSLDLDHLESGEIIGADGEPLLDVDGFLRGFDLDDAPEFMFWKEREHVRRMPAVHAGLLALIDHGRRRSSHDAIMMWAERLLSLDHLAEEGIRAQMEAFALVGDRVSALRIFDEWKDRLLDDLGAQPSRMVEGMAAQLRKRGWQPSRAKPTPAVPAEQWRRTSFVGRRHEYQHLYEVWEGVHHYQAKHLLITGDSGVGKTTLAQRLVTAAGLEGASVSRVQCYHVEQRIPYAAVSSIILGLLDRPGVSSAAPTALAELARIIPQVRELFARLPEPESVEGESVRLLFAEAAVDLLRALLSERPVLIVVDDWIYADEVSRAVLHLITRRIDDRRFMVVATLRSDVGPDYQSAERELSSLVATRIALEPMPREDCLELLDAILPEGHPAPSSTERRALAAASRGYPMALELFVQDWVASGSGSVGLALSAFTPAFHSANTVTADPFREIVGRILTDLSSPSRHCLHLAAVLGPQLSDLAMYGILGITLAQTMESLSALADRRVLRDVGTGTEFMNELVRAHVYGSIPLPLRIHLHSSIANRLIARADSGVRELHLAIAWHLVRSQRGAEAVPYLISGSEDALTRGAPDDVILALESFLREMLTPDDPAYHKVASLLIEALYETSRWEDGLRIAAAHETLASTPVFRVLLIEANWNLGRLSEPEQRHHIEELVQIGVVEPRYAARAIALGAFMTGGLRDEALIKYVEARMDRIPEQSTPADSARILMARANLAFHRRQLDEGEEAAARAQQILRRDGTVNSVAIRLEIGLSVFRIARGDYATAYSHLAEAIRLGRRIDNHNLTSLASGNAALACLRQGDFEKAIRHATDVRPYSDAPALAVAVYSHACALALVGRNDEALNRLEMSSELMAALRPDWIQQMWMLHQADVLWLCGQRRKALSLARKATIETFGFPLARGLTGIFVRWAIKAAGSEEEQREAGAVAISAWQQRDQLDTLDRYELTTAMNCQAIRALHGIPIEDLATERDILALQVPQATQDLLRRVQ